MVADSCETFLRDSKLLDLLIDLAKKDLTLFEKMQLYVDTLLNDLRECYNGLKPDSAEGKLVLEWTDSIEELHRLWEEAAMSALDNSQKASGKVQKNTTEKGDVKYSLRDDAKDEVKKVLNSKNYIGEVKLTDSSPSILLSQKGVRNLPMVMKASHIRENIFTEEEAKNNGFKVNPNINYHGLGEDLFLKVIDGLDDVKEAYRGTKNADNPARRENYFLLISQYTDKDGNIINVPVFINEKGLYNRVFIDTNKIATVFGRSELRKYISKELDNGNLVRIKKRSTQVSESTSPINADYEMVTSNNSISNPAEKVKENTVKKSDRDYSLEKYSETQYNNFGWVRYNNVLSAAEYNTLLSRYADYAHNKNKYPTTRFGEAVIHSTECPDVIMYIKGRIGNPAITKIVRIKSNEIWAIPFIKEEILKNENERNLQPFKIVEDYFGYGVLDISKTRDYATFRQYLAEQERGNSKGGNSVSGEQQDGTGSVGENNEADRRGEIKYSDRDYSYEALTNKPDMEITTINDQIKYKITATIRKNIVNQAVKNAASIGKTNENDNAVVYVKDIGTDVILSKNGLRHGLDRRFELLLPITLKAGEILKNSIRINELTPTNEKISKSYVLIGVAKNKKNEPYIVSFVVNRATNEVTSVDVLYAINAKTEPAGSLSPSVPANIADHFTDSNISISNLLDYVNKYFPDILPEDVLKHYGHTERPAGKLGESALFSDRDPAAITDRGLLADALTTVAKNESEIKALIEYKSNIELMYSQQEALNQLNRQIKELSFAKGKRDMDKLRFLKDEAIKTTNRINLYDKKLLVIKRKSSRKSVMSLAKFYANRVG